MKRHRPIPAFYRIINIVKRDIKENRRRRPALHSSRVVYVTEGTRGKWRVVWTREYGEDRLEAYYWRRESYYGECDYYQSTPYHHDTRRRTIHY